jgi:hypothetical protein
VTLAAEPPARPQPPRSGPFDSPESRWVRLQVEVGTERVLLQAWCRVGIWTTLERFAAREFVVRESWGRLGSREPRRLARVEDEVLEGVLARLRPEDDGGLAFVVEVSRASVEGEQKVGDYHGEEIALSKARRHGYRFTGRAPAGSGGPIARWGREVVVRLGDGEEPPAESVHFSVEGGASGLVAGPEGGAEAFVEEWLPAKPIHVQADGVERMDYRLVRRRRAAGFEDGGRKVYGSAFHFDFDG